MPKDWGQVKAQLRTYYVVDQLSVAKVQALMEEQHGFTASIRSYRSRLKDWGYRRQDERRSIVSNELAQRRATSPTLEVIAVSDKSSNEDNTAIEAETTPSPYRERLTRLTSDIHTGTSQGLSTGGSALTVLPSGLWHKPPTKDQCHCPKVFTLQCLHDAAREDSVDTVQWMLEAGAVATMQDESGNTPLHIAINHLPYSPEIVCLLASSTNVNLKNSTGLTPFHQLLEQADLWQGLYTSTVDNFLTLGADQQLDFPSGKTPLWVYLFNCATLRQHLNDSMFQVIKKFLKQDNSLRSWLLYRERVLEWALEFDDPSVSDYVFSIARRLCDTVDINQCTTNRLYPLHQAIRRLDESAKFEVCIGILLDRAADPNGLDDRCLSPLQVLFHLKKEDDAIVSVTKTLLEFGADPMRGLDSSKWTILLANHNLPLRICRLTIRLLLNASFDQITRSGITLPLYYGWQSRWLGNWVKACESISNWHDIRRCLEAAPEILGPHVGELSSVLFDVGVELLAGKCVETANAYIETGEDKDLEELRRRRNGVALALGDCRKLGIAIEDAWYECLLKLCEIIAERELGF